MISLKEKQAQLAREREDTEAMHRALRGEPGPEGETEPGAEERDTMAGITIDEGVRANRTPSPDPMPPRREPAPAPASSALPTHVAFAAELREEPEEEWVCLAGAQLATVLAEIADMAPKMRRAERIHAALTAYGVAGLVPLPWVKAQQPEAE